MMFRWFATLQKSVAPLVKRGGKDKPSAELIIKGLFYFFFLLKF